MAADASPAARIGWYVRRLRSMQAREMLWRVRQATALPSQAGRASESHLAEGWSESLESFRTATNRPILLDRARARIIAERTPALVAQVIQSADESADGRFQFFGHPRVELTRPIDWRFDPISDVRWPDTPSARIDHRIAGGDAKWIWELNRLQHLPWLAQAWLFTGDERYSRAAFEDLDTWIDQNPPGRGIAWRGAFEAGLRAISIAVALQGLRDAAELTVQRYQRIVSVLATSAGRCWRERSLFSSANNHLIGEMAGLAVVAMMFPELPKSAFWERRAVETLSREAGNLILPDGCGAEQSIGYQIATVELFSLVAALLRERDGYVPEAISAAIVRSSAFLSGTVGRSDPDPRFGDSDHEFALRLGAEESPTIRHHLGVTASLGLGVGSQDFGRASLSSEWYREMVRTRTSPDQIRSESTISVSETEGDFYAPEGGLVVLRRGRRRVTMDTGPLGYPSIAAHGHADALSVTISDEVGDLIGDPGTGSYYRHPQWRAVMRGTRAHPTVCVDGENQSVIGGPFLWSSHAGTRVLGIDLQAGIVDAEHDGYLRLPGRVGHRRWLIAPPDESSILIVDLVSGQGRHEVRTSWPLHPSLYAQATDRGHHITRGQAPVLHLLHAADKPIILDDSFGDEHQALGWWSDRLESRIPSWWLGALSLNQLPLVMATLLQPEDAATAADLKVARAEGAIEVTWTEGVTVRHVAIRVGGAANVTYS